MEIRSDWATSVDVQRVRIEDSVFSRATGKFTAAVSVISRVKEVLIRNVNLTDCHVLSGGI